MDLAAPLLTKKKVLQISAEVAKGDGTTPAADLWVQDLVINPTDPFVERQGSGIVLGHNFGVLEGTAAGTCSFKTPLVTTGAQGLNASLVILLQCCGMKQSTQTYTPTSVYATMKTLSIGVFEDGKKKYLKGAMGTFTMSPENGQIMLNFNFSGVYVLPTTTAMATPVYSAIRPLNWGYSANVFTLDSQPIKMTNWTFDIGNTLTPRMTNGLITNYIVTGRNPTMTMDVEADFPSGYDYFTKWSGLSEVAISLAISNGTDKATLAGTKFQYREIPEGDRDGILTHDLVGQFNRVLDAGDDEFSLAIAAA